MLPSISQIKRYLVLKSYFAKNDGLLNVHGIKVSLPMRYAIQFYRQIFRQTYEQTEVALSLRYLPRDKAIVELGSSLRIVSAVLRNHLDSDVPMISVEANRDLVEIAATNLARYDKGSNSRVIFAAISYAGDEVLFSTSANPHVNSIQKGATTPEQANETVIRVPAITLEKLVADLDGKKGLSLVCDIEGAEMELFENATQALQHFDTIILETHPLVYQKNGQELAHFQALVAKAGLKIVAQEADVFAYQRDKKA